MAEVFIALGSNMGDRSGNLRRALEKLHPAFAVGRKSKVYETEPMYINNQPRFYNMVVSGETLLTPQELLVHTKSIERSLGRDEGTHNLPRPIDIDILLYEDLILDTPDLVIPHPRMHERGFVMMPLEEIASLYFHPKLKRPIVDLWDEIGKQSRYIWPTDEQI